MPFLKMEVWQKIFLLIYLGFSAFGTSVAYRKVVKEKNNLGLVGPFIILGAFVWADLLVFGIFSFLFSLVCLILNDFILFLLGQSVFWFIRSMGEANYWFNQQFSTINRNPKSRFFFSKLFSHDEYTIWFVMQIFMQCVSVVTGILSIYFAKIWLATL